MIALKEYKIEDWTKIDNAIEPFIPPMPMKEFLEMSKRGVAVTGVENGEVVACGGIAYISETEGTVWLKMSKKCFEHSYSWARTIKETFGLMKEAVGDLRISTYVLDNFCKGEKLARWIGLKKTDEVEEYNGNIYHKYTAVVI